MWGGKAHLSCKHLHETSKINSLSLDNVEPADNPAEPDTKPTTKYKIFPFNLKLHFPTSQIPISKLQL